MNKPNKPYPDFPLTIHNRGKFYKKINGKSHYFGRWDTPGVDFKDAWREALQEYNRVKDYLHAGVEPPVDTDAYSIEQACSDFYDAKLNAMRAGSITVRTLSDYKRVCEVLSRFFGVSRAVESIGPSDFRRLREDMAKKWGPVTILNVISRVKIIFNWCYSNELIEKPVRYGAEFKKPSRAELRRSRSSKPRKEFTRGEIRLMIDSAGLHLKAMILLAINGGLGQMDLSSLSFSHLEYKKGWVDFPRTKTGIERLFPLWPETTEAIKQSIQERVTPDPRYKDLVFITKYGREWIRDNNGGSRTDGISQEFRKLKARCGITGQSKGFYAIRHTFRTVADECKDQPAIFHVMGHADASMGGVYRERIADKRLKDVTDHVHSWLYSDELE